MALIRCRKRTATELVADRVDRPGEMVRDEDTNETTPEETAPSVDEVRDDKAQDNPEHERAAHEDRCPVMDEVLGIAFRCASPVAEHPTNMGVDKALERTVRIAGLIRQTVMFPVRREPGEDGAFHRHRSQREQDELDNGTALK